MYSCSATVKIMISPSRERRCQTNTVNMVLLSYNLLRGDHQPIQTRNKAKCSRYTNTKESHFPPTISKLNFL